MLNRFWTLQFRVALNPENIVPLRHLSLSCCKSYKTVPSKQQCTASEHSPRHQTHRPAQHLRWCHAGHVHAYERNYQTLNYNQQGCAPRWITMGTHTFLHLHEAYVFPCESFCLTHPCCKQPSIGTSTSNCHCEPATQTYIPPIPYVILQPLMRCTPVILFQDSKTAPDSGACFCRRRW